MYQYILVPATGTMDDGVVFETAFAVARQAVAHIAFLHPRLDVRTVVMAMASSDFSGGTGYDQLFDTLEAEATAQQGKAQDAVRAFCTERGIALDTPSSRGRVSAEWRVDIGQDARVLLAHARSADLLVSGRTPKDLHATMGMLHAALLSSGRPLLLAPPVAPDTLGRRIVIAWKDTAEAARAVAAATPLIDAAESVTILSVAEHETIDPTSADRLCEALRWHNQGTVVRHLLPDGREPIETLLRGAAAERADLLVMGGYSHSRVREMVFGGFTRHVLEAADLPVLMAH